MTGMRASFRLASLRVAEIFFANPTIHLASVAATSPVNRLGLVPHVLVAIVTGASTAPEAPVTFFLLSHRLRIGPSNDSVRCRWPGPRIGT